MTALSNSPIPHLAPLQARINDRVTLLCAVVLSQNVTVSCLVIPRKHWQQKLSCLDLASEAHDTHHPTSLRYEDQRKEAVAAARHFRLNRLPKFLTHIANAVTAAQKRAGGGPFAFEGSLSVADLALFQTMKGIEYAFPAAYEKEIANVQVVGTLVLAVQEHDRIKSYLQSLRRMPFNENGIFRFYSELQL